MAASQGNPGCAHPIVGYTPTDPMSAGRNDPCPCGSGKKFKRCCGVPRPDPLAEAAARTRAMQELLERRILRHARDTLGRDFLDRAWDDFVLDAEGIERDGPEIQLFFPWAIYRWVNGERDSPPDEEAAAAGPIAERYRRAAGPLPPLEDAFLKATMLTPFTFHEVIEVEAGRSLLLRDLFEGKEILVYEQGASRSLEPGDIVFTRAVSYGDVALLIGTGATPLPPDSKIPLISLRKDMRKVARRDGPLGHFAADDVLRRVYFELRKEIVEPSVPVLKNTDGDLIEMHRLTWKTPGAEETFRALASLAVTATEAEIREDAEFDRNGQLRRVEFSWEKAGNAMHEKWSNTLLGRIVIDRTALTVEVNSAQRADRIRAEVATRLGTRAFGPSMERIEIDDHDAEPEMTPFGAGSGAMSEEEIQNHPEVIEYMRQANESHWESWIHEKIPALGNKKPSKLVKTAEGREMVEALLLSFERGPTIPGLRESNDMNPVRRRLGLPLRSRSSDVEGS